MFENTGDIEVNAVCRICKYMRIFIDRYQFHYHAVSTAESTNNDDED